MLLFLFITFASALTRRSTSEAIKFSELGKNGNYRHCISAKDTSLLQTAEVLDHSRITPTTTIALDEAEGVLRFAVELFYLPRDAYYLLSIGTKCFSRPPVDRDEGVDDIAHRSEVWGHAPNALYRGALSDSYQYGAYYSDTAKTGWSVRPDGCSHVVYTANFTLSELVDRCGVDSASLGNGEVLALSSLLNIQLFELDAAVHSTDWTVPFSLYLDERDSSVVLYQTPEAPNSAPIHVLARSISVDPLDKLSIVVQTQQAKEQATTLRLGEIFAHGHEPSFELDIDEESDTPYVAEKSVVVQNWRLSSHSAQGLFDGDFTLHLCSSRSDACDKGHHDHAVKLSVRIASGGSGSHLKAEGKVLHSEITQHDETATMVETSFESGSRACMQTYVIGPEDVTGKLSLELDEAWLCVDADDLPEDQLACPSASHRVQLFGSSTGDGALARNVTVHYPGAYGPTSVGVCFDANALFPDDRHVSVIRRNQRYETLVRIGYRQFRTPAHEFVPLKGSLFATVNATRRSDELGLASLSLSQSLQAGPFSRYRLAKALETSRELGKLAESHAHLFDVEPEERHLHNMNNSDAATALGVIFVTLICFIFVVVYLCLSPKRKQERVRRRSNYLI